MSLLPFYIAKTCDGGSFFGFPTWYHYLTVTQDSNGLCTPQFNGLTDIWLIVAAVIEILLRLAAILAVIFVIYGGFVYLTSQGEAQETAKAKDTIVNALVGLAISVMAATIVAFIARSIK